MMAFLQPISIFVSTLSITAIALDRRRLIICPHEPPYQSSTILGMVPGVWVTAIILASPMAAFKKLESWTQFPQAMDELRWASNNAKVIFLSTFYTDQPRLNINKKFRKFHIHQNWQIHLLVEIPFWAEIFSSFVRLKFFTQNFWAEISSWYIFESKFSPFWGPKFFSRKK